MPVIKLDQEILRTAYPIDVRTPIISGVKFIIGQSVVSLVIALTKKRQAGYAHNLA